MGNVLDDEGNEQTGDHDGTCCSFVLDSLDAIVRKEELCVREQLRQISG